MLHEVGRLNMKFLKSQFHYILFQCRALSPQKVKETYVNLRNQSWLKKLVPPLGKNTGLIG